jgi:hypothetical protein
LPDTPGSPKASRLATPGWLDGRLVLGVLLVLVSVVVGARVLSAADRSTLVYAVTKDLAAGSVLQAGDLEPRRVRLFEHAGKYVPVGAEPPTGYVVRRGLGKDELLPRFALSTPEEEVDFRLVTVAVDGGRLPQGLTAGQQVDIWVTPELDPQQDEPQPGAPGAPEDGEPAPAAPAATAGELELRGAQLVLQGVAVKSVSRDGGGFGASTSVPVELQVRPNEVAALVSAMALGTIDLVRVPRAAESSGRLEPVPGAG